jgi:hypothetical protein
VNTAQVLRGVRMEAYHKEKLRTCTVRRPAVLRAASDAQQILYRMRPEYEGTGLAAELH